MTECQTAMENQCKNDIINCQPSVLPTPEDLADSMIWAHTIVSKNACKKANIMLKNQANSNCVNEKGVPTDCLGWVEDKNQIVSWRSATEFSFNTDSYWNTVYTPQGEDTKDNMCDDTPGPSYNPCGTLQKKDRYKRKNGPLGSVCLKNKNTGNVCGMSTTPIGVCEKNQGKICADNTDCDNDSCLLPNESKNPFNYLTLPGSCVIATKKMCNAITQLPYECPPATGQVGPNPPHGWPSAGTYLPVACTDGDQIEVGNFCRSRTGRCVSSSKGGAAPLALDQQSCEAKKGKWVPHSCKKDSDCNDGVGIGGVCSNNSANCTYDDTKEGKGCDVILFSDGTNPKCSPSYKSTSEERGGQGALGAYTKCCNCNTDNNVCKRPYLEWRDGKLPVLQSGVEPGSRCI